MKIVIPSNRDRVISVENFPPALMAHVDIVRHITPIDGDIGSMRQQYIDEYDMDGHDNIIMLDDDLIFQTRRLDGKHTASTPSEIYDLFCHMQNWLDNGEVFVGVSNRFMINTKPPIYYTSAPSMIYGISLEYMYEHNIRFDAVPLCEDWHVALSIYESGRQGMFTSDWCVSDASNGKGGLEDIRDRKGIREAMFKFQSLHPDNVTIREKEGGKQQRHQTDLSMTVQWKKAFNNAIK